MKKIAAVFFVVIFLMASLVVAAEKSSSPGKNSSVSGSYRSTTDSTGKAGGGTESVVSTGSASAPRGDTSNYNSNPGSGTISKTASDVGKITSSGGGAKSAK